MKGLSDLIKCPGLENLEARALQEPKMHCTVEMLSALKPGYLSMSTGPGGGAIVCSNYYYLAIVLSHTMNTEWESKNTEWESKPT